MTEFDQIAPGGLEDVRVLLNSWLIPNTTREPTDRFAAEAERRGLSADQARVVRRLRDDLRELVERRGDSTKTLNAWIKRAKVRPVVEAGEVRFDHAPGPAGELVAAVVTAIDDGTWPRLKACADCRWVFYDTTRNGSKRWCMMTAGDRPDGRACGTIAKVRRHRQRAAAARAGGQA